MARIAASGMQSTERPCRQRVPNQPVGLLHWLGSRAVRPEQPACLATMRHHLHGRIDEAGGSAFAGSGFGRLGACGDDVAQ